MNAHLQRIYAASQGTHVALASADQFTGTIAKSAAMIGVPMPSPESARLMHGVLTEMFMWATCEDIELAVKLNFTRNLPSHTEAYGEFSSSYLSTILRVYEPERGKAIQFYRRQEDRKELPPRKITDDEWRAMIDDHYAWRRAGNDNWKLIAARMVTYLWDSGLATDDLWTVEDWKMMRTAAKKTVCERTGTGEKGIARMNGTQRERFDGECLMELRAVVYGKWLDNFYKTK